MNADIRTCGNCGHRIRFVNAPLGGAWQHLQTMSIYCDLGGSLRAIPFGESLEPR